MGTDEPVAETLVLLISELVTNAVVHTGCPAVLRMLFGSGVAEAGTVRVEVADTSARPPCPRHAEGEDTNGRGLELVDGLADRWGWQPEGSGKRIWCEVDRSVPDAEPGVPDVPGSAGSRDGAAYDGALVHDGPETRGREACDTDGYGVSGYDDPAPHEPSYTVPRPM
jgi:hypothetical protein